MKRLSLISLALHNFKGHRDFTLLLGGNHAHIYGDNATGKSTIADAISWCLFGKDSRNQADFGIKTTVNGEVLHNLDHTVEAVFDLNGERTTFTRTYRETYEKKRGSSTAEFTGHTTDYRVNGVPVTASEYNARVAVLCPAKLFRTLTDPLFFNTQMDWKARRAALFQLIPGVSDADVINGTPELSALPAILGSHSPEEYSKIVKASQTKINEELKSIPGRIDEASRAVTLPAKPEVPLEILRDSLQDAQERRAAALAGGAIAAANNRLSEANRLVADITIRLRSVENPLRTEAIKRQTKFREVIASATRNLDDLALRVARKKQEMGTVATRLTQLREASIDEKTRQFTGDTQCPSCGQELPEDRKTEAISAFNLRQSQELERIKADGLTARFHLEALEAEIESLGLEIARTEEQKKSTQAELDDLVIPEETRVDLNADPDYIQAVDAKKAIEAEIEDLKGGVSTIVAEIDAEIAGYQTGIRAAEAYEAAVKQQAAGEARVKELEARQREVGAEYEKLEGHLYLLEQFVRTKSRILTDLINQQFTLAKWNLFENQVNGGLSEICEVTVGGVPFTDLNTAARINVGLDIINTLALHHAFIPPVVIDGAESVTMPLATQGQQIQLIVSPIDKTLRVEVTGDPLGLPDLQPALI